MASQAVRLRIVFITLSLMNVDDLSEKMLPWDPKTLGRKKNDRTRVLERCRSCNFLKRGKSIECDWGYLNILMKNSWKKTFLDIYII